MGGQGNVVFSEAFNRCGSGSAAAPAPADLDQNVNLAPSWMRRALLVLPFNLPNVFALVNA